MIQYENIPQELKSIPNWVCWKIEERPDKNGDLKETKVPYNARTKGKAMSDNPSTWSAFEEAVATYEKGGFNGIGFELDSNTGVMGVDLDNCVGEDGATNGVAVSTTQEIDSALIVKRLATYTEISPSGTGIRIFCFGKIPGSRRRKGAFEMYQDGRFLTVTGNRVGEWEGIRECSQEIKEIYLEVFGQDAAPSPPQPSEPVDLSDRDLLDKMFASPKNGSKIRELYNGGWQSHYTSQSEADSALCFFLAFWTRKDTGRMDSLFRGSGLMRDKWDQKKGAQTYGHMTIERACSKTNETYSGPAKVVLLRGKSARSYIGGKSKEHAEAEEEDEPEAEGVDEDEKAVNNGIYAVLNGRTVLAVSKTKTKETGQDETSARHFICDFAAHISGAIYDETGNSIFQIEGRSTDGATFSLEVPAGEMMDPKKLGFKLSNATNAGVVFHAGMEKHLGPSIKSFTDNRALRYIRSFDRTGWTKDSSEFIIPGMQPEDVELHLDKELAFRVEVTDESIDVPVDKLLSAHVPEVTTILFAHSLLAPLLRRAGWQDEKFAAFIVGRSGTLKTSWAQMNMSIYGDFGADDKLLKFGAGGTVNAMMSYPAAAADLPLLIDNFKPGTGNGNKDAQTMVHGLIEGTERKRLNRDGTRRASKEYRCLLQFTGEDTLSDAASLMRMLIVGARDPSEEQVAALTWVQAHSHLLPRIGGAYLKWVMSADCLKAIEAEKENFGLRRGYWVKRLREHNREMVNAMRVATSLTLIETVWAIAAKCPALASPLDWWKENLKSALEICAEAMAGYSEQSHEANRYIAVLRALIIGQRAYFRQPNFDADKDDRRIFLGWEDDDMVYLLPDVAFAAALDALKNQNGLNGLGQNTISKQLDQLGFLAKKDGSHFAPKKKLGTNKVRVLFIPREKFYDDEGD